MSAPLRLAGRRLWWTRFQMTHCHRCRMSGWPRSDVDRPKLPPARRRPFPGKSFGARPWQALEGSAEPSGPVMAAAATGRASRSRGHPRSLARAEETAGVNNPDSSKCRLENAVLSSTLFALRTVAEVSTERAPLFSHVRHPKPGPMEKRAFLIHFQYSQSVRGN